jgi:hypothetical protein
MDLLVEIRNQYHPNTSQNFIASANLLGQYLVLQTETN